MSTDLYSERPLYGGAISSTFPNRFQVCLFLVVVLFSILLSLMLYITLEAVLNCEIDFSAVPKFTGREQYSASP